jgi:uncharacterized protein DUF4240
LIGKIDRDALRDDDEEAAIEPLVEALGERGEDEIKSFEDMLAQYLFDIDGKAWADEAGKSGQSDDGFLYVRYDVVAMGKKFYDKVKADSKKMPKDAWCESLLLAAQQAWGAAGKDEESWDHQALVSNESGSNKVNWT